LIPEGNSDEFEVWIAEIGQLNVSGSYSQARIDKQPAAGVLFTSSKDYNWSVRANQDMKYAIDIADFNSSTQGTVYLQNLPVAADIAYSEMIPSLAMIKPDKTGISLSARISDVSATTTGYFNVDNLEDVSFTEQKTVMDSAQETSSGVKSIMLRADLSTSNRYISRFIDLERTQAIIQNYKINNLTYRTISGTASVVAGSNVVTGNATSFFTDISNGEYLFIGGVPRKVSSITNSTSLIVATNFVANASGATITSSNEENPSGPYASLSRYITRRVELADGFEANDLNVYVDVNRPAGTDVKVYYKVMNEADTDVFDDKLYQEMQIDGIQTFSEDQKSYTQEKYVVPSSIKSGGSNLLTGSVTISSSATTVTGVSTRFLEELKIGDIVRVNADTRVVSSVANNTSLTVDSNFTVNQSGAEIFKLLYNTISYTTPDNKVYSGYKYFAIKIVFLSSNQAIAPRIKRLRAIALT
jgi:hypothetical protein